MAHFQIASDVHTEFHRDHGIEWATLLPVGEVDALIIAGDYGNWPQCMESLKVLCARFPRVIYITGNHEYYGSSFPIVHSQIREFEAAHDNFEWLHNQITEVAGQRVLGATLWFSKTNEAWRNQWAFNDFHQIRGSHDGIYEENKLSMDFLDKEVKEGDVVITHHMPSKKCTSERFRGSSINCYFVCPMDYLIVQRKPKIWIHGHTHDSKDFYMGAGTRVVCNPYGYVGTEMNRDYEEPKIVEA